MQTAGPSGSRATPPVLTLIEKYKISDIVAGPWIVRDDLLLFLDRKGSIVLMDLPTGGRHSQHPVYGNRRPTTNTNIPAIAVSPLGRTVAVLDSTGHLELFALPSWNRFHHIDLHLKNAANLCLSPDGHAFACSAENQPVTVYDLPSGHRRFMEHWAQGGVFSPDSRSFAASGIFRLRIWDVRSRHIRNEIKVGDSGFLTPFAFAPDGQRFYVRSDYQKPDDHSVVAFDARSLKELQSFGVASGDISFGGLGDAALSGDGRLLATCRVGGGSTSALSRLTLWDTATGKTVAEAHGSEIQQVALSATGRYVAARSYGMITVYVL